MKNHLTDDEILKYTGKYLKEKDSERIQEHIKKCDLCYDRIISFFRINKNFDEIIDSWTSGKHSELKKSDDFEDEIMNGKRKFNFSSPYILRNLTRSEDINFHTEMLPEYKLPDSSLLEDFKQDSDRINFKKEVKENCSIITERLSSFGIEIKDIITHPGPVFTTYELITSPEITVPEFLGERSEINRAFSQRGTRIINIMPGKLNPAIEIPNSIPRTITAKDIITSDDYSENPSEIPIAYGMGMDGKIHIKDLRETGSALITGDAKTGKTTYLNSFISSSLYKFRPDELKFIFIDSGKNKFRYYTKLKNHYLAYSSEVNDFIINEIDDTVMILKNIEKEIRLRYEKFVRIAVGNINEYNKKITRFRSGLHGKLRHYKIPYLIILIDELSEIVNAKTQKSIKRILQYGRDAGVFLIAATRYPSKKVLPEYLLHSLPARASYRLESASDSINILGNNDASRLLKKGDLLCLHHHTPEPVRVQSPYISEKESSGLVDYISSQKGFTKPYMLPGSRN